VEIPPFYGEESEHEADNWIGGFEDWAVQENLNSKKKIQLVLLGLFGDAYEWARQLNLEKAKWKEFVCLFREKYAGDPTPWSGSPKFPYWLYFSGTARPTAGQVQGRAGVGIVIVSPLKELQIAHVHQYLGRFCSIHVAEYTALVMGMETALQRGVRHLTVMCDSELVFNQVTGKWTACHSSIRDLKLRVRELLNEFQTCGALYISPKCNTEAQFLAKKAIDSSSDSTSISRRKGFKPVSCMALTRRLTQHPLPQDQMKKCEQMGCVLCMTSPPKAALCEEYTRLASEANPTSQGSSGATLDHLSECQGSD
jgi:ribonuclease HI